ncbi:MAG: hypothetical protein PVH68_18540 [Armatimonadota bacterium]|jgi:hypothetical protein
MTWIRTMSRRPRGVIICAVIIVILVGIVAMALAQPAPPAAAGDDDAVRGDRGRARGDRGFGGRGFGGRGFGGGPMAMGMMPPAIAVADDAVFVVKGNAIYKFDAETLELIAHAQIPQLEPPPRPER